MKPQPWLFLFKWRSHCALKQEYLRDQESSLEKCLPDNVARMQGPSIKGNCQLPLLALLTVLLCFRVHPLYELSSFLWRDLVISTGGCLGFLASANVLARRKNPRGGGGEWADWGSFEMCGWGSGCHTPGGRPSLLKECAWKSRIKISGIRAERKTCSKPGLPISFAVISSASVHAVQSCFSFLWTSQKLQIPEILNKLNLFVYPV